MKNNNHTVKSRIVCDALEVLSKNPLPSSYVSGGISLQLRVPEEYHRETSDIDLTTSNHITIAEFRNYIAQTFIPLMIREYDLKVRKRNSTLDAYLESEDDHLMIQAPRRSVNNHLKREKLLEREVEHGAVIPYSDGILRVIAYEDLIGHKILRSRTFMECYNLDFPKKNGLPNFMTSLKQLKSDFDLHRFSSTPQELAQDIAKIRLYADFFDIQVMYKLFGNHLEPSYLSEAFDSYEGTPEKRRGWEVILENIQNRV